MSRKNSMRDDSEYTRSTVKKITLNIQQEM